MDLSGYLHGNYAAALAHLGHPHRLPGSGAWILERPIVGTHRRDAIGCYPLLCCLDWSALRGDLDTLDRELVSLCAVTDPLADRSEESLMLAFRDLVRPFKRHYVVDLAVPIDEVLDAHHRRNVKRGISEFIVERAPDPAACAPECVELYMSLSQRHGIKGHAAFSPRSLALQLDVPGATVFRALRGTSVEGVTVWYTQGAAGYYHLGAYSEAGYHLRASYALFYAAISYFRAAGLRWLDLGGVAGLEDDQSAGLARFKRGWSSETRMTYLCGRILDSKGYEDLEERAGIGATDYFPAYRAREIA